MSFIPHPRSRTIGSPMSARQNEGILMRYYIPSSNKPLPLQPRDPNRHYPGTQYISCQCVDSNIYSPIFITTTAFSLREWDLAPLITVSLYHSSYHCKRRARPLDASSLLFFILFVFASNSPCSACSNHLRRFLDDYFLFWIALCPRLTLLSPSFLATILRLCNF